MREDILMAIRSIKIITVDDSPVVTNRLQSIFDEIENIVYTGNAINADEALVLVKEQTPDVVFLDIHLGPDQSKASGFDLLISFRNRHPKMQIIMLTNLTGNKYRETCLAFGADYFLDKTLDFDKIPSILNEIARSQYFLV